MRSTCTAPYFGVLFLWAACPGKGLLAFRNCFQSDGTKEIAYCYLWGISLATSESELLFQVFVTILIFPLWIVFPYPLPYFSWMVCLLLIYESSSNIIDKIFYFRMILFHIYHLFLNVIYGLLWSHSYFSVCVYSYTLISTLFKIYNFILFLSF